VSFESTYSAGSLQGAVGEKGWKGTISEVERMVKRISAQPATERGRRVERLEVRQIIWGLMKVRFREGEAVGLTRERVCGASMSGEISMAGMLADLAAGAKVRAAASKERNRWREMVSDDRERSMVGR